MSIHVLQNKKHIHMNKKILIVDANRDDQCLVELLLKRSLYGGLHNSLLSITYASSFTEAQNCLSQDQFDIITLDGEFPSFVNSRLGQDLIPYVWQYQHQLPIIMMITDDRLYLKQGKKHGVAYGFTKKEIFSQVKLNERFELVPAKQLSSSV